MVKYIEFGEFNKNYNFIILAVIFSILIRYLPKFLITLLFKCNKISERVEKLFSHSIIKLFYLLFMLVFSCILNIYESNLSKRKSNFDKLNDSNSEKGCFKIIKINEDNKKEKLNNRKNILNIIIIVILIISTENLVVITSDLKIFSYSMIILLILSFINTKIFKIKIFKHQKCAILFNFSMLFVFELSSLILSMKSENNIYRKYLWLIPIGLIIYFLSGIALSYAYSKIKSFMDLNFISLSKLLINFALVGIVIKTIICVVFTFIKCDKKNIFCNKQEEGIYYIENFTIFFDKLLLICKDENKSDLIFVICLIFLSSIIFFLYNFFFLSILKNLYPEHYFFTEPIKKILFQIFNLFYNKIDQGYFFAKEEDDYKILFIKFILDITGHFLIIVGFLIYLEIIELNFCGFNYYFMKKYNR